MFTSFKLCKTFCITAWRKKVQTEAIHGGLTELEEVVRKMCEGGITEGGNIPGGAPEPRLSPTPINGFLLVWRHASRGKPNPINGSYDAAPGGCDRTSLRIIWMLFFMLIN